ncbi:hypothetical protein [Serratia liquefaciens]|uniref:hypothetical protein n=1 Tax=Serratia liquefaciens TaxID=614 RepID=UPI003905E5C6
MAKVIFEFTEGEAVAGDAQGRLAIPVCIGVTVEEMNDARPGNAECLALIMKQKASAIIRAVNEVHVGQLKDAGASVVKSELINTNEKHGDKNVH